MTHQVPRLSFSCVTGTMEPSSVDSPHGSRLFIVCGKNVEASTRCKGVPWGPGPLCLRQR